MMIFVGVDWAEAHHDVCLIDESGVTLGKAPCPRRHRRGEAVSTSWLQPFVEDPTKSSSASRPTEVCSSAPWWRLATGSIAVNPFSASRYRDRHSSSGAKSDPGDAEVLADLVRTDAHNHREIAGDSELAEAMKILARAHQSMIWTPRSQVTSCARRLREYYPERCGLRRPTLMPQKPSRSSRSPPRPRSVASSHGRRSPRLFVERVASAGSRSEPRRSKGPARRSSLRRRRSSRRPSGRRRSHRRRARELNRQIAALEKRSPSILNSTRTPRSSAPCQDWGRFSAPGCWASSGMTRTAMPTPSLAKITPARRRSPGRRAPSGSCSPASPGTDGSPMRPISGPFVALATPWRSCALRPSPCRR